MVTQGLLDFTMGTTRDGDATRKQSYIRNWLEWSRYLAHNASEMAQVEEAINHALAQPNTRTEDFAQAREALQVVDLNDPTGNDSAPLPDYFFLSGFVALATGQPITNTHATHPKPLAATAAYELAIKDIAHYVPSSMTAKVYADALQSINQLVSQFTPAVPQGVRREAQAIQACLGQAQAGVAPVKISCVPK